MINPPKATKPPEIKRKEIMDWNAGTVTDYNAQRLVDNALTYSVNMELEQNGVLRPRPALVEYGPQPVGEVLGELFECKVVKNDKPVFYLVVMMLVEGKANVYYAKGEDKTWTKIDGKDYEPNARAHFLLIDRKVLVMNGADTLSYINTDDWTITVFTALSDPATVPTLEESKGLDGTAYKIYYAITANSSVGETKGSPVFEWSISTRRDMWNSETQSITIKWDPVEGATGYNVYMGLASDGTGQASLYLIAANLDATTFTFTDNGVRAQDLVHPLPEQNSTAGPKVQRGVVVNGRIWAVGDTDNPHYVWYGGDPGHELDFSIANGGGFHLIASGTREIPIAVMPFRQGTGNNTVVVLTQGSNGNGKRYHLTKREISYDVSTIVAWEATEDSGTDGTDSPDGVVIYNNSLYYPSRDGFKTTGTQPQLQNVLSTTRISNTIKNEISLLNTEAMDRAVGVAYEGKIYWSLPCGSTKNNRIWVLDLERKGAWVLAWYLNADWMTLYNDNSGTTHFLLLSENRILDFSRTFATQDRGAAFSTEVKSGELTWSKDGREWARLIQVVFTLLRPMGDINIEIFGETEDGKGSWSQNVSIKQNSRAMGWSEGKNGWTSLRGWSELRHEKIEAGKEVKENVDVMVEIDEDMRWFGYRISSTSPGVDYALSSVVAEYVPIGIKDLS